MTESPIPSAPMRVHAEERPAGPPPLFLPWQPNRQVVWDASSLKTLQECPAKYDFKHIQGWMSPGASMDLEFGGALGAGLETFYREIIESGADHDTALRRAIRVVLSETWDHVANLPRMGRFIRVWRCLGLEKYKNAKGNWARCPFSHKGKFYPAPRPSPCSCGSATTEAWRWCPFNRAKDRVQLIRALVWYAEEQKATQLRPISFGVDGGPHTAALELPFLVPFTTIGGVQYWLCGWWDAVKQLGGQDGPAFVTDYKTTRHTLSGRYWEGWQPNTQIDIYDLVASRAAPIPVEGVAIEAIQVGCDRDGNGWVRFGYRNFARSPEQRAEVAREVMTYMGMAASFAQAGYWPMNRASCRLCEFKAVCNLPAHHRQPFLEQHFIRARWNPLTRTTEIPDGQTTRPGTGQTNIRPDDNGAAEDAEHTKRSDSAGLCLSPSPGSQTLTESPDDRTRTADGSVARATEQGNSASLPRLTAIPGGVGSNGGEGAVVVSLHKAKSRFDQVSPPLSELAQRARDNTPHRQPAAEGVSSAASDGKPE